MHIYLVEYSIIEIIIKLSKIIIKDILISSNMYDRFYWYSLT